MRFRQSNATLCHDLLIAESQDEVIQILKSAGYWDDRSLWRPYGDQENNFSQVGNQQGNPIAAMAEKLTNAVDAVLMLQSYLHDFHPENPRTPRSIASAVERYFGIKDGNLANTTSRERTELARKIGFMATGRVRGQNPSYIVFDFGEGQTPKSMPDTLLSLARSNKQKVHFVHGKFNMGGTGVLPFCGRPHHLQLVISKRHPEITDASDSTSNQWGFTIVRREEPSEGRRSSMYTYLAPNWQILSFSQDHLDLSQIGAGTEDPPRMKWGTIIKLFEYEMTGAKTNIKFDFNYHMSLRIPRIGLPVRLYERRSSYKGHSMESTFTGLHVRLEDDRRDNLEPGFPSHVPVQVKSESLLVSIYAFKRDQHKNYKPRSEGVIFTLSGHTHAIFNQSYFTRGGLGYIADSVLVTVECNRLKEVTIENLFLNSRDRMLDCDFKTELEARLQEILKDHAGLRELRERRKREDIDNKLENSKPMQDILNSIIKRSPSLSQLFLGGKDLKNPFKSRMVGEQDVFRGQRFPTFFRLMKGENHKSCHLNHRFRVKFETDAENDYFGRDTEPGQFKLEINDKPAEDFVCRLWNGVATVTVSLPPDVEVGDEIDCTYKVSDISRLEDLTGTFIRRVEEDRPFNSGEPGNRLPPAGGGNGNRQEPDGLMLPNIVDIHEEEWSNHQFDKYSALKVIDDGDQGYIFFVNLDNIYLRTEMKPVTPEAARLLEARFRYGMVLIGLGILKEQEKFNVAISEPEGGIGIEDLIRHVTSAISPLLLPLISGLNELELEQEASSHAIGTESGY